MRLNPTYGRYANYDLVPEDVEAAHISGTLEILKSLSPSGEYPKGYYIERPSISSEVLLAQAYEKVGGKLGYDSSVYGDDLPYYAANGTLLIPHTLDCKSTRFPPLIAQVTTTSLWTRQVSQVPMTFSSI